MPATSDRRLDTMQKPFIPAATTVTPESFVVASSEQVSCDLAGEAVILSLRTGVYHGLDPIAARIWTLIQQPASIASVCDSLLAEYDVTAEQCSREVVALLEQLAEWQLVDVVPRDQR